MLDILYLEGEEETQAGEESSLPVTQYNKEIGPDDVIRDEELLAIKTELKKNSEISYDHHTVVNSSENVSIDLQPYNFSESENSKIILQGKKLTACSSDMPESTVILLESNTANQEEISFPFGKSREQNNYSQQEVELIIRG